MSIVFGQSVGFPMQIGNNGRLSWSAGEQNIAESIEIILKTSPGERVGLPGFGAGLNSYLFAPNNAATHAQLMRTIEEALSRWEPRIQVKEVLVQADTLYADTAIATITYNLVASGAEQQIAVSVALTNSGGN
jgi:uncharacterized protein